MATPKDILEKAIALQPLEKAELVDTLISSLDRSDSVLDQLWAKEAESRLSAYKMGELKSISLNEVLSKYK
ncbi:MAG: addiction module protein [Gammaproteobacteria bacterium]|nr:addiction module protein [Gammaproteobacteria bacterium]MCW8988892.1 addiction module protein [Gammaproteobacteria bacterium]MCW9030535.1 addiction module protein [Gammaproteobacteria bacterium]